MQSSQFKISGLLQPFLVPKPYNHWRPILGQSKPNLSETIRTTLQQWEWVTSIDFKDAYFHIPIQEQSRTYQISCPGSDIPVQSTVFRSVHCTHGAHCSSKGVETDGHTYGYNNPPVLRRLVGESHIPPGLSPAYTRSSENMPSIRLAGEFRKIGTGTKRQVFDLVGYQFDLIAGRVRPIPDRWQNLQEKILEILSLPACPVQQFMSDRFTNSHRKASSPRPTYTDPYSGISKTTGGYQSHQKR